MPNLKVACQIEPVLSLCKNNTNFSKELVATYHTILHEDIKTGENILYFKDTKIILPTENYFV